VLDFTSFPNLRNVLLKGNGRMLFSFTELNLPQEVWGLRNRTVLLLVEARLLRLT
jgi:hypothetical protein